MTTPRLSIALVTFNGLENVRTLLRAIRSYSTLPHQLIVVDNGSTDGTLELLQSEKEIELIANGSNRRCAAATNQAIDACNTEFLVYLCASHALVTDEGWDQALVRYMYEHPDVPLAGHVWKPGFRVTSGRFAPGWSCEALGLDQLHHVQGGAWIARRSVFDELGNFNDREHPHSGMDVEFSYRLQSFGRSLGDVPSVLCPAAPALPTRRPGVSVYHPATPNMRNEVREALDLPPLSVDLTVPSSFAVTWTARGDVEPHERGIHLRGRAGVLSQEVLDDVSVSGVADVRGVAAIELGTRDGESDCAVLLGGGTDGLALKEERLLQLQAEIDNRGEAPLGHIHPIAEGAFDLVDRHQGIDSSFRGSHGHVSLLPLQSCLSYSRRTGSSSIGRPAAASAAPPQRSSRRPA